MAKRDVFAIGGSAGSTDPLRTLLAGLPAHFPAAILVVTHIPSKGGSHLRQVLAAACAIPVAVAEEGEEVVPGRVYLAPADRHLLVVGGRIRLGVGPRENMVRPSIDPLFRCVALEYGPRATAVILSGMLNDGASGADAVHAAGGEVIVQDSEEAAAPDMPLAALDTVGEARVLTAAAMAPALAEIAGEEAGLAVSPDPMLRLEIAIAEGARLGSERLHKIAEPVALSCPHCAGVLSELKDQSPLRYRCQIGHAYTADILFDHGEERVEQAMRVALRIMEERAELVGRMAEDARRAGRRSVAELYDERGREYVDYADTLRRAVVATMQEPALQAEDPGQIDADGLTQGDEKD